MCDGCQPSTSRISRREKRLSRDLASALTLLWPPQYRSLTRCACSCVGAADGAQFSTAIVALALRSRGWRAAAVGAAAAAGDARRRRRRRWRGPLWSGGGSGGPSVALPAREHTHTHNISSCAFAVSAWVRAVARTRSTHTNSPRPSLRGTWARPAMSEDAALEEAMAPLAHGPSPCAIIRGAIAAARVEGLDANAHRAARAHARGARRFHKAAHSTCSKLEENGCCTTRAMRWFAANAPMRRVAAPRGRPAARGARAAIPDVDV